MWALASRWNFVWQATTKEYLEVVWTLLQRHGTQEALLLFWWCWTDVIQMEIQISRQHFSQRRMYMGFWGDLRARDYHKRSMGLIMHRTDSDGCTGWATAKAPKIRSPQISLIQYLLCYLRFFWMIALNTLTYKCRYFVRFSRLGSQILNVFPTSHRYISSHS